MTTDIRTSQAAQRPFMTFAYAFSVTSLVICALVSNIFALDTFRQLPIRSTTVGMYLIAYSCCSIFGVFMLQSRLFRMLDSFTYETSVLLCSVISGLASISTRTCLWLNSFIALQRSFQSLKIDQWLNRIGSVITAPIQILVIITTIALLHVHEFIYRVSVVDPQSSGHFICQILYTPSVLRMNTIFSFIHLCIPLVFNVVANCLILASISRRRATLYQTSYWTQWKKHFRRHYHLFLAPTVSLVSLFNPSNSAFMARSSLVDLYVATARPLTEFFLCQCLAYMATTIQYSRELAPLHTTGSNVPRLHFPVCHLSGSIQDPKSFSQAFRLLPETEQFCSTAVSSTQRTFHEDIELARTPCTHQ